MYRTSCRLPMQGIPARQYDAWDLGMTTTDDFTNADIIYEVRGTRCTAYPCRVYRKSVEGVPHTHASCTAYPHQV